MSAAVAGLIVVNAGYGAAFWTLAAIAVAGFALFLVALPETAAGEMRNKPIPHPA